MPEKGGYPYEPDYVVPPGWVLEEYLEVWGISQAELARRCSRSPQLIRRIIAGEAPVTPAIAFQLGKVFALDADTWLRMEAGYREGLAQGKKVPDLTEKSAPQPAP